MDATGGSRSRQGGNAAAGELWCSFCGQPEMQVERVIAGPGVCICSGCVDRVHTALATPGATVSTPVATIRLVSDPDRDDSCSFCGKSDDRVAAMAAAGDWRICSECLDLCDEIIEYNQA